MWGIDMVFVVGGNGGNAGAAAIQAQCEKDGVICNIVGVPKSIDNDILVVSFYPMSKLNVTPAYEWLSPLWVPDRAACKCKPSQIVMLFSC